MIQVHSEYKVGVHERRIHSIPGSPGKEEQRCRDRMHPKQFVAILARSGYKWHIDTGVTNLEAEVVV
jgi:hypothetical protein